MLQFYCTNGGFFYDFLHKFFMLSWIKLFMCQHTQKKISSIIKNICVFITRFFFWTNIIELHVKRGEQEYDLIIYSLMLCSKIIELEQRPSILNKFFLNTSSLPYLNTTKNKKNYLSFECLAHNMTKQYYFSFFLT